MNRLLATMSLDFRLQARNRFYHISAFVVLLFTLGLRHFFAPPERATLLPVLFLFGVAGTTYMLAGALILFEKGEHTLAAQSVTPLRVGEYLLSKLLTLTALVIVESLCIVLLGYGLAFRPLPMLVGLAVMGAVFALAAFIVVVRYRSINDFLVPSMLFVSLMQLPFLHYFGVWRSPIFYLWPTQPPLLLLQGAFEPLAPWQWGYALGYALLVMALLYGWSQRAFDRYIVQGGQG